MKYIVSSLLFVIVGVPLFGHGCDYVGMTDVIYLQKKKFIFPFSQKQSRQTSKINPREGTEKWEKDNTGSRDTIFKTRKVSISSGCKTIDKTTTWNRKGKVISRGKIITKRLAPGKTKEIQVTIKQDGKLHYRRDMNIDIAFYPPSPDSFERYKKLHKKRTRSVTISYSK